MWRVEGLEVNYYPRLMRVFPIHDIKVVYVPVVENSRVLKVRDPSPLPMRGDMPLAWMDRVAQLS
jgi:hypothetical protein